MREVSNGIFQSYTYDANGNMITAIETNGNAYVYSYNAENRLSIVNNMTTNEQWYFTYDGNGVRVMEDYRSIGMTQYYRYFFAGGSYEVTVSCPP